MVTPEVVGLASRFPIGLVTCFAMHDGVSAMVRAAWRR
jgi:hypothetical protein